MRLDDVQVLAEALLQGAVAERAGGLEGGPLLEREVLLEEERGDLAEACGEAGGGGGGGRGAVVGRGELGGSVEADVGEAREGIGDLGEVGREVGAGDLAGVGGRGRRVRERGRRGPR